jgi:hypothetical protein
MKGWNKISVLSLPDADGLLVGLRMVIFTLIFTEKVL